MIVPKAGKSLCLLAKLFYHLIIEVLRSHAETGLNLRLFRPVGAIDFMEDKDNCWVKRWRGVLLVVTLAHYLKGHLVVYLLCNDGDLLSNVFENLV